MPHNPTPDYYPAGILYPGGNCEGSAKPHWCWISDYSPFGSNLSEYQWVAQGMGYRYGFNSQEKDDEIYGAGNSYTAEYWQYDARLGRRWNVDPVVKPYESSYATFANNPIWFIDPLGADTILANRKTGVILDTKVGGEDYVFMTKKNKPSEKAWKKSEQLFHNLNISGNSGGTQSSKGEPVVWSNLQDMTEEFNMLLLSVNSQFAAEKDLLDNENFSVPGNKYALKLEYQNQWFKTNAPYDVKQNTYHPRRVGEWSWYDGRLTRYDDYGNMLYGSAGTALGLPKFQLVIAAEVEQWASTLSSEVKDRDPSQIKLGIELFKEFSKKYMISQ